MKNIFIFSREIIEIHMKIVNFFSGEKLFLNGSVITNAMNPEEGLKSFMDFLKSIVTGANKDEECILVAHNGARYDHTVIS